MCWIWSFKGEEQPSFSKDFNDTGFCFCRPPFTDYLSELGKEGFSFGDVELPEGADLGVGLIQDDDLDGPQAVVAENDNYLIDQSEATCEQVNPQQWLDKVTGTDMFCYSLVIWLEWFWIFLQGNLQNHVSMVKTVLVCCPRSHAPSGCFSLAPLFSLPTFLQHFYWPADRQKQIDIQL